MAITLIAATGRGTAGTTPAVDTTGANLIVSVIGTTGAIGTMSDNKGNLFGQVASPGGGTGQSVAYVTFNPVVGAGHTFTLAGAGFPSMCVAAFSGLGTFPYLKTPSAGNTGGAVTSIQTGSITPPVINALVLAFLGYRDTTTVSVDSGFSIAFQEPFIAGTAVGTAIAYLVQTTALTVNPTFSWTNAAGASAMALVFQPPSSGGGGGIGSSSAVF